MYSEMKGQDRLLFPAPARLEDTQGCLPCPRGVFLEIDRRILEQGLERGCHLGQMADRLFDGSGPGPKAAMSVQWDETRPGPEAFRLEVGREGIRILCGGDAGAYYALGALGQLVERCGGDLPCLVVEDAPALTMRGVLLDVGRGKIPTSETLRELIDKLSAMRYNHLELYMEGYAFAWARYAHLFPDETPITPEELRRLDRYARSRYVELVPCVNVLGHMEKWLEKPQLRHLAEREEGYLFQNLYHRPPMTLNARDGEALDFALELVEELAGCVTSRQVNVCLDEPFELGTGKNAAYVKEHGKARLYLDYLRGIHRALAARGRRMLLWGDVVFSHPESLPELPRDVLLLDWMYEGDGDFGPHARVLAESGREFCLCPGTSTWCSFTGRSDSMLANIQNAVERATQYGARGILLTDWGDLGHWQYLSASYPAFAWGAACAWSGPSARQEDAEAWCNRVIYQDPADSAWQLALDMGNYYKLERAPLVSTTLCAAVLASKYRFSTPGEFDRQLELMRKLSANLAREMDLPVKPPRIEMDACSMRYYLNDLENRLEDLDMRGEEGTLIRREMAQGLAMVRHGLNLYLAMTGLRGNEGAFRQAMALLLEDLEHLLPVHFRLWNRRNRRGGYAASAEQFTHLLHTYRKFAALGGREETKGEAI